MLCGLAGLESPRAFDSLLGEPGEGSADLSNFVAKDCGVDVSMFRGRRFSPDGDGVGLFDVEGESSGPGDRWPPHCDINERTGGKHVSQGWPQRQSRCEARQGSPFQDEEGRHRRQVVVLKETYRENEAWWLCDAVCLKPLCNTTFSANPAQLMGVVFCRQ